MIRLSKLADYAVVLMAQMVADDLATRHSAAGLSAATGIPTPTVSKILGALARSGLLVSHRGVSGGFALARPPQEISVADVITAVDGPIAVTHCLTHGSPDNCDILDTCRMRGYWTRINGAIHEALGNITLVEVATPHPATLARPAVRGACHEGFSLEGARP
jgi:FeS assembly SUF system regulator